jgi:hypothetical protein
LPVKQKPKKARVQLFHTSPAHIARFDALRDRIAPGLALHHTVREDWLDSAKNEGLTDRLSSEVTAAIQAAKGPSLCTCTTIGDIAEAAGATRIDRPMMQAAAALGGEICLVYCLASTKVASTSLLQSCIDASALSGRIEPLFLPDLWPLFEKGEEDGFARAIAAEVANHLAANPDTVSVVLAQASMEGAARYLDRAGLPVLTAPEIAFRATLTPATDVVPE